jgi:hypothetical protein
MAHVKHTSLRIKPDIRALADRLCELEHRDLTNMIEIALIEYGRQRGVMIQAPTEAPPSDGPTEREMLKRCILALAKQRIRTAGWGPRKVKDLHATLPRSLVTMMRCDFSEEFGEDLAEQLAEDLLPEFSAMVDDFVQGLPWGEKSEASA